MYSWNNLLESSELCFTVICLCAEAKAASWPSGRGRIENVLRVCKYEHRERTSCAPVLPFSSSDITLPSEVSWRVGWHNEGVGSVVVSATASHSLVGVMNKQPTEYLWSAVCLTEGNTVLLPSHGDVGQHDAKTFFFGKWQHLQSDHMWIKWSQDKGHVMDKMHICFNSGCLDLQALVWWTKRYKWAGLCLEEKQRSCLLLKMLTQDIRLSYCCLAHI